MRTDAKSLFLVCLLVLLAMLGWRGYVEFEALRAAMGATDAVQHRATLPAFGDYKGLGILEYVEEQARPDTRALPVDLFRPTLDSMVSNLVAAILNNPDFVVSQPAAPQDTTKPTLRPGEENLFELVQQPSGQWIRRVRQQPAPELTYNGVFQRTDGRIAAWITERNSRKTQFYAEGDDVYGAKLKTVTTDEITVLMPGGEERTMPRGGSVTLPAPPATTEEVAVQASGEKPRRDRSGGGDGVFRRGGAQRMPTDAEMDAIARANPDLAKKIRDAVRRRQEQGQQQGANP